MRRVWRDMGQALIVIVVSAVLALTPAAVGAQAQSSSDPASGQSAPSVQSESPTTPAQPGTPSRPAQSADEVGTKLRDSAKSFGEAILGGIKFAGRKVITFFSDDKSK
jgi:hypothetical protein